MPVFKRFSLYLTAYLEELTRNHLPEVQKEQQRLTLLHERPRENKTIS